MKSLVRDLAMAIAIREVGTREEGGPNRGPRVEQYLSAAGLPPGQPWCMAFVVWCYVEAAKRLGGQAARLLPVSGHTGRLWLSVPSTWHARDPAVGAVAIHAEKPRDLRNSKGHTGIVYGFDGPDVLTVEGNTNVAGSREGTHVLLKKRPLAYWNVGFIDVARGE